MTFTKGTKLVVKAGSQYSNDGAIATVEKDQRAGSIWVTVLWDEPKSDRVNGEYIAASFDVVDTKTDLTTAIATLVDKTHEEAYAAGHKNGLESATTRPLSDLERELLRDKFNELNRVSEDTYTLLQRLQVI